MKLLILSILLIAFIISLLPIIPVMLSGAYSFGIRPKVLKEMDKQPGVWMWSSCKINLWIYLDAKRQGLVRLDEDTFKSIE